MRTLVTALSLILATGFASAEDALMQGGRSPDGRFEVRIVRHANSGPDNLPDTYSIHLHAARTAQPFYSLDSIGGYNRYGAAIERCRALWHSSGEFVVITDQATRHSKEIYIVAISNGRAERLDIPDYIQNALGRVGATEIDLHCISTPKAWSGDDLLLTLYFSARPPRGGRHFYTSDVTLHLSHGPNIAPTVGLKSVTVPIEKEG
jgi:hypothetical protein